MNRSKFTSPLRHPWLYFVLAFVPTLAVITLYGINMVNWRNSPDFGWRAMYESGPNVAADLFERAKSAGLETGDKIVAINGQKYSTFEELFFEIRDEAPGSINTYTVLRNGKEVQIDITTGRIGMVAVLKRSGPLFFLGFIYFLIGVLVFLMKPKARESFLFLLQASSLGAMLCYQSPSDLFRPLWLFDVRIFIEVFMPAPMMHLALRFPKTRSFLVKWPKLRAIPYLLSLTLFIAIKMTGAAFWNIPPMLNMFWTLWIMLAVLTFLVSVVWNRLRDLSAAVKLQSQTILLGIFIGFFIPSADLISRSVFDVYLFPDPVIGFVLFLAAFPLSIGFTIVKYDLFAIDKVIKRTYGYLLTTGAIGGIYALVVSISNLAFGSLEITRSPAFPLVFILAVVFFFNPVRNRVQRFIDRVFYRLEYDYQETVHKISETMRTLLGPDEISKSMMRFSMGSMFIDSGAVMLLNRDKSEYVSLTREGKREDLRGKTEDHIIISEDSKTDERKTEKTDQTAEEHEEAAEQAPDFKLQAEDPLVKKIAERKKEVTIYDIQGDPFFESDRDACAKVFDDLGATLIVPLIYEDQLTGLIALGQKKSGKFYRLEDINLLNILANQSAVAIENAQMIEEVIEKERMEEELTIARDLQISMLPAECPTVAGFDIAAYSMSAREVGGDFYDFIEMGKDKAGFVIGDVTGKSVSGALVMSASRSVFRMLSEEDLSVGESMMRANRRLKKDVKSGMFVALLYAVLNSQDRTLTMCSAGQTLPVIRSAKTAEATLLETEGDTFPLGILEDADYEETRLQLQPGDKVVFYTDGIVEAMNEKKEIYGFERLQEVIKSSRVDTAEALMNEVIASVDEFAGRAPQHDDITVIVVSVAK